MDHLDARLIGGRIAIGHVAVADRDAPMTNLFELGVTELSIDTGQLVQGRVIVRDATCRGAAWATPRQTSGALTPEPDSGAGETPAAPTAAMESILTAIPSLDVAALLEAQAATLRSPRAIADANARIGERSVAWSKRVEQGSARMDELTASLEKLEAVELSSFKTVKDIRETLEIATAAAAAAQAVRKELSEADKALAADVAALVAKVDLSPGGLKSMASSLSEGILQRYLGRYYCLAVKARDAVVALVRGHGAALARKGIGRTGRVVAFPSPASPRFLMERAAFSLDEHAPLPRMDASVADLTSDPDFVGRPFRFSAAGRSGAREVSLAGSLDLRTRWESDLGVTVRAAGLPFAVSEGLEAAGMRAIAGTAGFRLDLSLAPDGGVRGSGSLSLFDLSLEPASQAEPLLAAVSEAVTRAGRAAADFAYRLAPGGRLDVTVSSDLDAVIARSVGERVSTFAGGYGDAIRTGLMGRLGSDLEKNRDKVASLAESKATSAENLARLPQIEQRIAAVRKGIEKKLAGMVAVPGLNQ
ncbi:MAG: hypothetical protein NTU62_07885 [Spirochaetes bacterium]|nr:hypothetical protein [Spirochaetota bacterium]